MVSFTYDADGLRLTKVVDGVTHYYVWQGDRLVSESYGTSTLEFFYDESGMPYAFYFYDTASTTNNGYYYYVTNLQGDVVGIRDNSGVSKAVYQYNAWGEDIDTSGVVSDIETINPLRYRGYYYDSESGFYYLQSRYYSPEVGRFINADEFASTGQGFLGYNMFAYCLNTPMKCIDSEGTQAVQNIVLMESDSGVRGTSKLKKLEDFNAEPDRIEREYLSFKFNSKKDMATFYLFGSGKLALDVVTMVGACVVAVEAIALAPATFGGTVPIAMAFSSAFSSGAVSFVTDIGTISLAASEYRRDGDVTVSILLPTTFLEFVEYVVIGNLDVSD